MAEPTDSRGGLLLALQDLNNEKVAIYGYYYNNAFRHTGILIRFINYRDRIVTSEFTIDVSDVNGLLQRMQCVTWNCEARIVVNKIDPDQRSRNKVIKPSIRTFREETRSDAMRYVKRLLVPTSKSYQLFFNNCRDHTDQAIKDLCCDGQCCPKAREEALRNIQARRRRDLVKFSVAIVAIVAIAVAGPSILARIYLILLNYIYTKP